MSMITIKAKTIKIRDNPVTEYREYWLKINKDSLIFIRYKYSNTRYECGIMASASSTNPGSFYTIVEANCQFKNISLTKSIYTTTGRIAKHGVLDRLG